MKTKAKRVRRRQTLGEEIIAGLAEALAVERGEKTRAVVRRVPVTAKKAAARLLEIAESHPEVVLASMRER